jgi:hypothetical protein
MKAIFQLKIDDGCLVKIQDEVGNPLENWGVFGGWVNYIGNISPTKGYKIKVNFNDSLKVCGLPVNYPYKIPLKFGWNIIGYPQNTETDGKAVVQQLIDRGKLIKVQDETGNAIEDWGIFGGWQNGIGNFSLGEGYKVKVNSNDTLIIYESYTKSLTIPPPVLTTSHFHRVGERNGVDHMNINIVRIPQNILCPGDEIGVFDGSLCVGAKVISKQYAESSMQQSEITKFTLSETEMQNSEIRNLSIPVSACDGDQGTGFMEGNPFTIKLWKASTNKEFLVEPVILKGSSKFVKHESTFASLQHLTLTGLQETFFPAEMEVKIYPNPTDGKVYIQASTNDLKGAQVRVFNALGQQVMNRTINANPEVINLSGNVSGIYYIHLTGDLWSKTEKIILK